MAIHGELGKYNEIQGSEYQFSLQNSKLLKVDLRHGPVEAKSGSMVAYQGDATFENKGSGGMGKMLKKVATGEGVNMMHVAGGGEVFFADQAHDVLTLYLENDTLSVSGSSILAFSSTIDWDIQSVGGGMAGMMAGGLFNVTLRGTGFVAVTTDGPPVLLDVASAPTFADPQAAVMWSGGVQMSVKKDTTGGLKSMARGGSGETFQMAFAGEGFVLVQPSEGQVFGAGGASSSQGGMLGQIMGG